MPAEYAIIRDTTPLTATTKSYDFPGFGQPQAAVVIYSASRPGANPADNLHKCIGFTDGVRQNVSGIGSLNGSSPNAFRYISQTAFFVKPLSSSSVNLATFVGWTANGLTLNFLSAIGQAEDLMIILFKGLTNAYAASKRLTITGINDITDPNFKPTLVLVTCTGEGSSSLPQASPHAIFSFGAAHNNSLNQVSQGQVAFSDVNGSTVTGSIINDDSCCGQLHNDTQSWKGVAQDFDAQGFSINTTANPGDDWIVYLALEMETDDDVDVDVITTPVSPGDQAYTGLGFTPGLLMMGQTFASEPNLAQTYGTLTTGVATLVAEFCQGISSERGVNPANTQSSSAPDALIELWNQNGLDTVVDGAVQSFDVSGYTINYSKVFTSPRYFLSIAFKGEDTPAPPSKGSPLVFGAEF